MLNVYKKQYVQSICINTVNTCLFLTNSLLADGWATQTLTKIICQWLANVSSHRNAINPCRTTCIVRASNVAIGAPLKILDVYRQEQALPGKCLKNVGTNPHIHTVSKAIKTHKSFKQKLNIWLCKSPILKVKSSLLWLAIYSMNGVSPTACLDHSWTWNPYKINPMN